MAWKPAIASIISTMTPLTSTKTERLPRTLWVSISRHSPHPFALSAWLVSLFLFQQPLICLVRLSFRDELASHIPLIPVISGFLIYLDRKRIFRIPCYCPALAVPLLFLVMALWLGFKFPLFAVDNSQNLSAIAGLIALTWIAVFILFYGTAAFRAALFPLLFLFLMAPLPTALSERLILFLQKGSADACYALFRLIGVPVLRHGFQFALPGVEIEVAQQCSGIHSGLSLFIAGLLAEHFLLAPVWKKVFFMLWIFPIAVLKNAVRIVTISWLGIHVNRDFFYGALHRQGGLPFSFLALVLMGVLLWFLRRQENSAGSPNTRSL
jgi:exosortase